MNKNKAESLVEQAIRNFESVLQVEEVDVPVYVFSRTDVKEQREELIRSLNGVFEPYEDNTLGETITGTEGAAVVLYSFNIMSGDELNYILTHELVHRLFRDLNPEISRKQLAGKNDIVVGSGFTFFDEFIADTVTFRITGKSFYQNNSQQELIRTFWEALPGTNPEPTMIAMLQRARYQSGLKVNTPELGYYVARITSDPIITSMMRDNPRMERGFKGCKKEVIDAVEDLIETMVVYLNNAGNIVNAIVITEEDLKIIGELVLTIISLR